MKTNTEKMLLAIDTASLPSKKCALRDSCANRADEEIAKQVRVDKDCLACLIKRYERKIKSYIKRITGAPEETIDDIAQEVFIKVYLNIEKFDLTMKFSSWVYRIAHNEAVNRFVYDKRRRTESLTWEDSGKLKDEVRDTHDVNLDIQQKFVQEKLASALVNVPKKYQQVIQLNYFKDKSYQEIAEELEKPINTIGTLLNRAKKLLKKELLQLGLSYEALAF